MARRSLKLNINMSDDEYDRLRKFREKTRISVSAIVRDFLDKKCDEAGV